MVGSLIQSFPKTSTALALFHSIAQNLVSRTLFSARYSVYTGFRDLAGAGNVEIFSRLAFRYHMVEANHLSRRSYVDAKLLLLLRPEPAMRPPPEVNLACCQYIEAL